MAKKQTNQSPRSRALGALSSVWMVDTSTGQAHVKPLTFLHQRLTSTTLACWLMDLVSGWCAFKGADVELDLRQSSFSVVKLPFLRLTVGSTNGFQGCWWNCCMHANRLPFGVTQAGVWPEFIWMLDGARVGGKQALLTGSEDMSCKYREGAQRRRKSEFLTHLLSPLKNKSDHKMSDSAKACVAVEK